MAVVWLMESNRSGRLYSIQPSSGPQLKLNNPIIVVHGGAGDWPVRLHKPALTGVRAAADLGFKVLRDKGSALDAVETAVVSMENNPIFNAGTGSTLNLLGQVETDAAIMDGRTLRGGAVALLRNIRNPIKAARIVMDRTNHVLIAGGAAEKLAIESGLQRGDLRVPRRVRAWKEGLKKVRSKRKRSSNKAAGIFLGRFDTVGALAMDAEGNLAAGDSTGGVSLKLPGRIGDSPILGAGLYAKNQCGAATATGIGEQAMRLVISKTACDFMLEASGPVAATKVIRLATKAVGVGMGILTLDSKGRFGVAHNTRNLCWAFRTLSASREEMRGARVSK
jgi:beta-aspartyl-peptidase (threonine type)